MNLPSRISIEKISIAFDITEYLKLNTDKNDKI